MSLPPETALLQQEKCDIVSGPRQTRPPKAHERCTRTSYRARHFRRPSFVHHGNGSKEEAIGDSSGNKVFGSQWRDAGSLGAVMSQCDEIE
jgi:hypothetical protein